MLIPPSASKQHMTPTTLSCFWKPALLAGIIAGTLAAQGTTPPNNYLVHNLVSDLANVADHQDKNLINPWGNAFGSTPFWIADNGTGLSTLYSGLGVPNATRIVNIPGPGGVMTGGHVTGAMFNSFSSNTAAFNVATGTPASFMFCTGDGVIVGWAGADANQAVALFDNSKSGANYTGCALGGTAAAPYIFAANFSNGTVDVYDMNLNLNPTAYAKAFVNTSIPAGYAPYNVVNIGGQLYVTYAQQNTKKTESVFGAGSGYVAVFNINGTLMSNLIMQGALNAPWGVALAPASFGAFGGDLLVGNLGDGTINAFNPTTGAQVGTLDDPTGKPISIQGLWAIAFGSGAQSEDPGTLYFTAGPGTLGTATDPLFSHGLLGSVQAVPFFTSANILNAGSNLAGVIAPNTWVAIKGNGLSPVTATWNVTGATLPTTTGGVGVSVNGEAAPVLFVSNVQVNFLVPADISPGTAKIVITNNGLTSATVNATVAFLAPSFFTLTPAATNGDLYIAATHLSGEVVATAGLLGATVTTAPAAAGETIVLYGTGFGQTSTPIPNGQVISVPLPLPVDPTIVIDGYVANVTFAGVVSPGLYQFNVQVPAAVTLGQDALVVALLGDSVSQANAFIPIAQ
jgi:uncharacterized protein (TIGR03118 family)